jgi:hypothetical protein
MLFYEKTWLTGEPDPCYRLVYNLVTKSIFTFRSESSNIVSPDPVLLVKKKTTSRTELVFTNTSEIPSF